MKVQVKGSAIELVQGDITESETDTIVNAFAFRGGGCFKRLREIR